MALTYCHECGREISSTAKACPGCGAPASALRQAVAEQRVRQGLPPVQPVEEQRRVERRATVVVVAFVAALLGGGAYCFGFREPPPATPKARAFRLGHDGRYAVQSLRPDAGKFAHVFALPDSGVSCGRVNVPGDNLPWLYVAGDPARVTFAPTKNKRDNRLSFMCMREGLEDFSVMQDTTP